jgi:hypothetical protein
MRSRIDSACMKMKNKLIMLNVLGIHCDPYQWLLESHYLASWKNSMVTLTRNNDRSMRAIYLVWGYRLILITNVLNNYNIVNNGNNTSM